MSITNAQLRWVKSLAKKSARVESGRFFAEGVQSLRVLATNQRWLEQVYLTEGFASGNKELVSRISPDLIETVSDEQIDRMADANTPQGVMAICKLPSDQPKITGTPPVYLEQVSDPGNLGTIIRTVDASAAGTLLIGVGSADAFAPKVVRSSSGSIFNIEIIQNVNSDEVIGELTNLGYKTYAADMGGISLTVAELEEKHAWVFGNEAHGLSAKTLAEVDQVYSIPIFGKAESLNLSVAAGVALYHSAFAQRG